MKGNASWSKWMLIGIGILSIWAMIGWRLIGEDGRAWRSVIGSDGRGYYAYLSSIFIHHRLSPPVADPDHVVPAGDGEVIKYFAGTAVAQSPFFLVGRACALLTDAPDDDQSLPYQLAIALAGLVFLLFGLDRVRRLLLELDIGEGAVTFTLALLFFGTGIGHYGIMAPSLSHVYSFALIAALLLATRRFLCHGERTQLLLSAVLFGWVVLVRPVNAIVLLALPAMMMGYGRTAGDVWRSIDRRTLMLSLVVLSCVLFIQPLLWYLQCGHWLVRPYAGEGFLWTSPRIARSLFGAQKGLFFHWPLLLLVVPGMIALWRAQPRAAFWLTICLSILAYITSAWWSWEYGDSYGPRPYLDLLSVMTLPIAFFFNGISARARLAITTASAPLMLLQCFHVWQYKQGIIHPYSMDGEKWRAIFLRTGARWRGALGGDFEPPPYAPHGLLHITSTTMNMEAIAPPWSGGQLVAEADGNHACRIDAITPLSTTLVVSADSLPDGRTLYLVCALRRLDLAPWCSADALVVCELDLNGQKRGYYRFKMNDLPSTVPDRWRSWRYAFRMPAPLPGEALRFYIWQPGSGAFLIDDLAVRISAAR